MLELVERALTPVAGSFPKSVSPDRVWGMAEFVAMVVAIVRLLAVVNTFEEDEEPVEF